MGAKSKPVNFNGRTLTPHTGTKYVPKDVNYKEQLEKFRGRLKGEVGFILDSINLHNKYHHDRALGFFPMVRMLMPIIDALATLEGIEPEELFGKMKGVPHPNLMWTLYRDSLLHNDELPLGAIDKEGIPGGILISPDDNDYPEILTKDPRNLDVGLLYRSMVKYLDEAISKADPNETRKVIDVVEYDPNATDKKVKLVISEIREYQKWIREQNQ